MSAVSMCSKRIIQESVVLTATAMSTLGMRGLIRRKTIMMANAPEAMKNVGQCI